MTIEQSPYFGRSSGATQLLIELAPVVIMLVVLLFADPIEPSHDLAIAVLNGARISAVSLIILFLLFVTMRPKGWSPRRAVDTAQTITLWLTAIMAVSCVY